eukprot:SAG11_NODE_5685_length_1487_cov_1.321326_2_plen_124_part_01
MMSISYRQNNWSALLPKVQFSINSTVSEATGMTPYFIERGREPLLALDTLTLSTLDARGPVRNQEANDHLRRLQIIHSEVQERMANTRAYQKEQFNRKQREAHALLVPGTYAYLKSEGITMPWD